MRHEELKKTKSSSGLVLEIQTDEIFQKKKINGPNRPFQNYTENICLEIPNICNFSFHRYLIDFKSD